MSGMLTDEELMSVPIKGGILGLNKPSSAARLMKFPLSISQWGDYPTFYINCSNNSFGCKEF